MTGVRAVVSNAGCTFTALVAKSGEGATNELYRGIIVDRTSHRCIFCDLGGTRGQRQPGSSRDPATIFNIQQQYSKQH